MEELAQIFELINSGDSNNIAKSLEYLNFDGYGIDIPLMYGLSLSIQPPTELVNRAKSREEAFIYSRLLEHGGAIYISLTFLELGTIVGGMIHYNLKNGVTLFLQDNGIILNNVQVLGTLINKFQSITMPGCDIKTVAWINVPEYFNRYYYTGRLS